MFRNFIPKLIKNTDPFQNTPWHTFLHSPSESPPSTHNMSSGRLCLCVLRWGWILWIYFGLSIPISWTRKRKQGKDLFILDKSGSYRRPREGGALRVWCGCGRRVGRCWPRIHRRQNWHFTVLRSSADKRDGFHTVSPVTPFDLSMVQSGRQWVSDCRYPLRYFFIK